ncbi:synaptonemal complex protein 1 [Mastacembelus armatus]|uniref:synaptonemal complex protein 1 n=1 Tax=Mastacembelus armatus TaxID=205130 RepID=UPI000E46592D|nr:synaptonemal complex protein 1 [Mastacembelus armatus]
MERDRAFNFKLLVPPRVNNGQVSAVRPQETVENSGDFINTLQQGYSKCFDKEKNMPFPNTNAFTSSKPPSQGNIPKMKVVPPMEKEENNCNPGQLYSKLLDEVEKIKFWKVKVDSDTMQKERRLQENKRTIETQRKAIQELQFGNESLSIKLEEQISENADLRNKNSATRNLCNILKDTFQRSAEKMHLFESEREETHHLYMENSESIQKLIAAFESLRVQAEADQQEMQKVKEGLLHVEELNKKYHQEYTVKEKEVVVLQSKLKDKENELQKFLLDLHESQKLCKQLQETTDEQYELLKSSKTEHEILLQKLHTAQQCCNETEKSREAIIAALEQSREEYAKIIQSKDLSLQELNRIKNQQAEKLEQIQTTIQELQNSLALERERIVELEDKLKANNSELESRKTLLGEAMEQSTKKDEQIKILEDELDKNSKFIKSMESNIDLTKVTIGELTAELSSKTDEAQAFKKEAEMAFTKNEFLKKACEAAEKGQKDFEVSAYISQIKVQVLEGQLFTETKKNQECVFQMEQLRKEIAQHKLKYEDLLSNCNKLESEKMVIQQHFESGSSYVKTVEANMKVSAEKTLKLTKEIQRLEEENQCLQEEVNSVKKNFQGKCQETETLQKTIEENYGHLQEEITVKEKQIKTVETKLCKLRKKIETKLKAQEEYQKENKMLKKQIAKETLKSSQLERVINSLHEDSKNLKRLNEEDCQKLLKDLESTSTFAVELENQVQKLRVTEAEAIKKKEDAELKCQQKIADMVALMEKHKSQYDRMVEEKDAELEENKKKEMEAVAHRKSLELELSKHKKENDQLKKQLTTEMTEKENLQKKLTDVKNEISSVNVCQLSDTKNKQSPALEYRQGRCSETPKSSSKRHEFDFSTVRKTPSYSKDDGSATVMKKTDSHTEDLKTPRRTTDRVGGIYKIKSYRIMTPPPAENAECLGKSTIELDPKSDSSDLNDLWSFANAPTPSFSAPHYKVKKIQSPVTHKSPGNSLKLAAVKRMRDAGWTAVTGCDKKKKKTNEKIFA